MENYSVVIFIMAVVIGLSAIANKIKLPYPVLLIMAGIAVGFLPEMPNMEINPEVIFLIFLPPLLYDAAFNISFKEFRTNINTIGTLAFSVVFITASGIAVLVHYMIPGMTWPLSFVLGAILSATDAVAAMSITKGLGLSHKTTTILEGESLVNDASAIVAYRFAVGAATGTAFVFWKASLEFLWMIAGGLLIGLIIGWILAFIIKRTQKNSLATISFMLLMPFVTYQIGEELEVSGVIAVVILGLSIARFSRMVFPESLKQESKTIWDIIIYLLNGLIFILIGLQLPFVMKSIPNDEVLTYVCYALIITVVALLLRTANVFLQKKSLQMDFKKGKNRITEHALLDFKTALSSAGQE